MFSKKPSQLGPGPVCGGVGTLHNNGGAIVNYTVYSPKTYRYQLKSGSAPPKGYAWYSYTPFTANLGTSCKVVASFMNTNGYTLDSNSSAVYQVSYNVDFGKQKTYTPTDAIYWQINALLTIVFANGTPSSTTKIPNQGTIYDANSATAKRLLHDFMIKVGSNINDPSISKYFIQKLKFVLTENPTNYNIKKIIGVNERLSAESTSYAGNPKYGVANSYVQLLMQDDGNLVLYDLIKGTPKKPFAIWATNTAYREYPIVSQNTVNKSYLILGSDGNFVIKNNSNQIRWSSGIQPNIEGGALGLVNNFFVHYNPRTYQIYSIINPSFSAKAGILHHYENSQCTTLSIGMGQGMTVCLNPIVGSPDNPNKKMSPSDYFIGESISNWSNSNFYNAKSISFTNNQLRTPYKTTLEVENASTTYGPVSGGIYLVEPMRHVIFLTETFYFPASIKDKPSASSLTTNCTLKNNNINNTFTYTFYLSFSKCSTPFSSSSSSCSSTSTCTFPSSENFFLQKVQEVYQTLHSRLTLILVKHSK